MGVDANHGNALSISGKRQLPGGDNPADSAKRIATTCESVDSDAEEHPMSAATGISPLAADPYSRALLEPDVASMEAQRLQLEDSPVFHVEPRSEAPS